MSYAKFDLNGRVAVVVGGTSGIGRAIADGLAEAGAMVVPTSNLEEHVNKTVKEFESAGRETIHVLSDVCDRDSLQNLLDKTIEKFGKVDILVNSAGITKRAPTLDYLEEDWNRILEINLTGTLRACQIFGRHFIENGYGKIVNIASLSTFVSLFEVAAYSASKAAVASLTKSLAIEWAKHNINVNAIAPGNFPTPLNRKLLNETDRGREFLMRTPMKRFGKVEELQGAAIFLASDAASYVTGEVLVVDGGFLASGVNQ